MSYLDFNINETVRVRLNDRGRAILRAFWEPWTTGLAPYVVRETEDGWYETQLWALMEVFGEHLHIGTNPPFETTIQLKVSQPVPA